ncbi:MAG TPA: SAM-dependent methyltransferase [Steroidobacteraceae bacterium]|nr:SAM-dependent methyltransferase [Steroidobacteraceae bacterium]
MLMPDVLPPLSPDEARHSARVQAHVRALIAAGGGWLPFSRFMDATLYAPGLGYYMAGQARFGAGGDFVTAPELSPLFARCLAQQVAELLERADGGDIVEYGAGSGALAEDLLQALAARGAMPRRYRIVEVSAPLRALQRERLQQHPAAGTQLEWLDGPPAGQWQGVVIANEVLDALPVDRFMVTDAGCLAIGVADTGENFEWWSRPADAVLAESVARLVAGLPGPLPAGYTSEWRPMLPAWIAAATATLARGAMLIVDYGLPRAQYYHASRDGGTLCGFFRHRRVEDVFARMGLQDLTAWVDFSAVADAARACGLELAGFSTQAHFLISLGIDRELDAARADAGLRERHALEQGAATLLLPGEMGERFKVMALTRGIAGPLAGFSFRDLTASL